MTKKKNPKRGRPKIADARTIRVVTLFNDAEYALLARAARGHDTLSEYVRSRTLA